MFNLVGETDEFVNVQSLTVVMNNSHSNQFEFEIVAFNCPS